MGLGVRVIVCVRVEGLGLDLGVRGCGFRG